jgi:hypothetical protein
MGTPLFLLGSGLTMIIALTFLLAVQVESLAVVL